MKPTFGDFAKVMGELVEVNAELASAPLDEEMTTAYYIFKGLLVAIREDAGAK